MDARIAELQTFREELVRNLERCGRALAQEKRCPVVIDLSGDGERG